MTNQSTAKTWIIAAAIGFVAVGMVGCGYLTVLDTVISATEAAIPVLESAGVNIPTAVLTYTEDVAQCVGAENGSTQPPVSQYTEIAACLAKVVEPGLTGVPATVVAVIQGVAQAVEKFLEQNPPAAKTVAATAKQPPHSWSDKDVARFNQIKTRAAIVVQKMKLIEKGKKPQ